MEIFFALGVIAVVVGLGFYSRKKTHSNHKRNNS